MAKKDILSEFGYHSAIGMDSFFKEDNRNVISKIKWNSKIASAFVASGGDFLIHKTSKCLWRLSKDKSFIEPVLANDVLSEDDVISMEDETNA